jgi:hypothetical protein
VQIQGFLASGIGRRAAWAGSTGCCNLKLFWCKLPMHQFQICRPKSKQNRRGNWIFTCLCRSPSAYARPDRRGALALAVECSPSPSRSPRPAQRRKTGKGTTAMPPNPCPRARPSHRILVPWLLLRRRLPSPPLGLGCLFFFFGREEESSGMQSRGRGGCRAERDVRAVYQAVVSFFFPNG